MTAPVHTDLSRWLPPPDLLSFGAGPDHFFSSSALYGRELWGNAVAEIVALDSHVRPVPCAFVQPIVPLKRRT